MLTLKKKDPTFGLRKPMSNSNPPTLDKGFNSPKPLFPQMCNEE